MLLSRALQQLTRRVESVARLGAHQTITTANNMCAAAACPFCGCFKCVYYAVGNKLLMLFFPFLRKWTYARMHEQVRVAVRCGRIVVWAVGGGWVVAAQESGGVEKHSTHTASSAGRQVCTDQPPAVVSCVPLCHAIHHLPVLAVSVPFAYPPLLTCPCAHPFPPLPPTTPSHRLLVASATGPLPLT